MTLDPRLARDTTPLVDTAHAHVLTSRDARWPWLILVPRDSAATELHDLGEEARHGFLGDATRCGEVLQRVTDCQSVNIAMLGNVVSPLHCHVVARSPGDPNWPGPVWGHGTAEPRPATANEPDFAVAVRHALLASAVDRRERQHTRL